MRDKERVVLRTQPDRKRALHAVLRERGITVSDWFEQQLDLLLVDGQTRETCEDTHEFTTTQDAVSAVEDSDWAFADADTTYLSHDIHPYPAKFIPQIPARAIQLLTSRGDLVLDPFGGSGTTALEALRLGRRALSLDANPLSALIGRTKTARLAEDASRELRSLATYLTSQLSDLPSSPIQLVDRHRAFIPKIPNMNKWFSLESQGELGMIRGAISRLEGTAASVAALALSRIVISSSFQDSETRYASKPRATPAGTTLTMYLAALELLVSRVEHTAPSVRYGIAQFHTCDSRYIDRTLIPDSSIDLVVTSPPYGNATDYHLYHRFRLFWLGYDPVQFGRIEIGSHLRHQREKSGFPEYLAELVPCLQHIYRVLKPGAFAFLVLGDSVYHGQVFDTAAQVSRYCEELGFVKLAMVRRPLPKSRRSFAAPARRATSEKLLLLQRPEDGEKALLQPPRYKLWPYEERLRVREISSLLGVDHGCTSIASNPQVIRRAKRLAFSGGIRFPRGYVEPTWQHILENGYVKTGARRKDPKYVTHGIHPYKGKYYPQLAKSLLNVVALPPEAKVFDPYCGSGTTLLEARLNGLRSYGCDLNPLATKIAGAKVGILDTDPQLIRDAVAALEYQLDHDNPHRSPGFATLPQEAEKEILSWFAEPIARKIDVALGAIRSCAAGVVREFLEVVLSSLLRGISHQDPADLRIRRRKVPLRDADVFRLLLRETRRQVARLEHFWEIRGYSPFRFPHAAVVRGDSRTSDVLDELHLGEGTVDCVLTSPPYAMALPYVDTDRLSLLVFFGLTSRDRRPLERELTGSREITTRHRKNLEAQLRSGESVTPLPSHIIEFIVNLLEEMESRDVGFRRQNNPSLLFRFFCDMSRTLATCRRALRDGGHLVLVVGDNTVRLDGMPLRIPTTEFVRDICISLGFEYEGGIDISVTRDNVKHIRHAITKNRIIRLRRT